jgi:hypothetical protein
MSGDSLEASTHTMPRNPPRSASFYRRVAVSASVVILIGLATIGITDLVQGKLRSGLIFIGLSPLFPIVMWLALRADARTAYSVTITENGLKAVTLAGTTRSLPWSDIDQVRTRTERGEVRSLELHSASTRKRLVLLRWREVSTQGTTFRHPGLSHFDDLMAAVHRHTARAKRTFSGKPPMW